MSWKLKCKQLGKVVISSLRVWKTWLTSSYFKCEKCRNTISIVLVLENGIILAINRDVNDLIEIMKPMLMGIAACAGVHSKPTHRFCTGQDREMSLNGCSEESFAAVFTVSFRTQDDAIIAGTLPFMMVDCLIPIGFAHSI